MDIIKGMKLWVRPVKTDITQGSCPGEVCNLVMFLWVIGIFADGV